MFDCVSLKEDTPPLNGVSVVCVCTKQFILGENSVGYKELPEAFRSDVYNSHGYTYL